MRRFLAKRSAHDAPYWDGLATGVLKLQRSETKGKWQHYPRAHALDWTGEALEWVDAEGEGVVETFTVVQRSFFEDLEAPYVLAVILLKEGVKVLGHLQAAASDTVQIGMRVRVMPELQPGGEPALVFRPASDQ